MCPLSVSTQSDLFDRLCSECMACVMPMQCGICHLIERVPQHMHDLQGFPLACNHEKLFPCGGPAHMHQWHCCAVEKHARLIQSQALQAMQTCSSGAQSTTRHSTLSPELCAVSMMVMR